MFLEFPGPGGRLDPMQPEAASRGRAAGWLRISLACLLPLLLLSLGTGCSKHHNTASDPGKPPVITTNPTSVITVSGRPVSFTVVVTGAPTLRYQWSKDGTDVLGAINSTLTIFNPRAQDAGSYKVVVTNPNGTITSGEATLTVQVALPFIAPVGVVADASGNLFVSDMDDHTIWKVDATGHRTLLAGGSGLPGSSDAQGSLARFNTPGGLALDATGNLLVADTGNHTIRRVAMDGTVTTLAGSAGNPGSADGTGAAARFNAPNSLAVTTSGAVYISDSLNHTIRLMATDGTVSTYAGLAGQPGQIDGAAATAQFSQPTGLALAPNGTLYIADSGNSVIRTISAGGTVSLFAGKYNNRGWGSGNLTTAMFYQPVGLALDASGILYVADTNNHAIRKISTTGDVTVLAGAGTLGNADGLGLSALFDLPCGIALTPAGNLAVADSSNHLLRSVTPTGTVTTYLVP